MLLVKYYFQACEDNGLSNSYLLSQRLQFLSQSNKRMDYLMSLLSAAMSTVQPLTTTNCSNTRNEKKKTENLYF